MKYLPLVSKMAFRNVFKYGRRSVETFIVVFSGVVAVALVDVFMNGFSDRIVQGFGVADGHVMVTSPGYKARRSTCPLDKLVADPASIASAAETAARAAAGLEGSKESFAGVVALPSLRAPSVIEFGEKSLNSYITGMDAILPGDGLAPPLRAAALESGRYPEQGERGMVLAARDAARLGAKIGDLVIVLASDAYGSFGAIELPLVGVTRANPGNDPCLVNLGAMRELVGVDEGATEVALYLVDSEGVSVDPRSCPEAIRAIARAATGAGLDATPWNADGNMASALIAFMDTFMYAMYAIFVVVAAAGIANSVLLSVQDRTRDFATLRAVAFSSSWVKAIVALETLMVGAAASLTAVLCSVILVAVIGPSGLSVPESIRGIAEWMPTSIPARIDLGAMALIFLGGSLAPLAAAVYPLQILGRMKIREALAYV